jgi:hypothetical protein
LLPLLLLAGVEAEGDERLYYWHAVSAPMSVPAAVLEVANTETSLIWLVT